VGPARGSAFTAATRSAMTSRQSPTIGTSARRFLGDLGRVDVRVHDQRPGRETCPACRSPGSSNLVPKRDEQVGPACRRADPPPPCRACRAMPHVLRMAVRETRPLAIRRGDHRDAGQLGEARAAGRRAARALITPAADRRATGRLDSLIRRAASRTCRGVRPGHRVVAGQVERGPARTKSVVACSASLAIVDQDRPGTPGRGGRGRPRRWCGPMSLGLGDQEVVLGDRDRDAGDVGLLEAVGADQVARHLPG